METVNSGYGTSGWGLICKAIAGMNVFMALIIGNINLLIFYLALATVFAGIAWLLKA